MKLNKLLSRLFGRKGTKSQPSHDAVVNAQPAKSTELNIIKDKSSKDIAKYLLSRMECGRLVIPEGMTEIPNRMFDGWLSNRKDELNRMVSLVIPGTVKYIGERAFANCENLEEVILSDGLEFIGCNAFTGCKKLTRIQLPMSAHQVDGWAFINSGISEPVLSADGKVFVYYPQTWDRQEYRIPEGVVEIGNRAFVHVDHLKKLTLPKCLKRISKMAFINCCFDEIDIPEGVLIENEAFFRFKHPLKICRHSNLNALEEKMEDCRVKGLSFLEKRIMKPPQEKYWKNKDFCELARECAQGKNAAMERMIGFFSDKAKQSDEMFYAYAENFWLVRAYQYGSSLAEKRLIEWCEAYPDQKMSAPRIDEKLNGSANGDLLNALGFLFFKEDREYSLEGVDESGVVEVSSWESDEGPDEDGFGREEYYDWWYLDEHLTLLEGVGYIHSYSPNDKRCNLDKFQALHERVAECIKQRRYPS